MGYIRPSDTDWVTASWQAHKNRNPPSGEPGTDYGSDYGSPLYAVGDGVVTDRQTSNGGATGRYITIALDDGRTTRSLHLSSVGVSVGERVRQGEVIGKTGGSGYGSDHGYGSHVHQTLWPGAIWASPTIDFEKYLEDDMPLTTEDAEKVAAYVWSYISQSTPGGKNMAYLLRDVWVDTTSAVDGVKEDGNIVNLSQRIEANTEAIIADLETGSEPCSEVTRTHGRHILGLWVLGCVSFATAVGALVAALVT